MVAFCVGINCTYDSSQGGHTWVSLGVAQFFFMMTSQYLTFIEYINV